MNRLDLHSALVAALGSNNVYYQPPESLKMKYPCIVYERSNIKNKYADNDQYLRNIEYTVTVIDPNPDSEIVERVSRMPFIRHTRHFATQGLNHDIFTINY